MLLNKCRFERLYTLLLYAYLNSFCRCVWWSIGAKRKKSKCNFFVKSPCDPSSPIPIPYSILAHRLQKIKHKSACSPSSPSPIPIPCYSHRRHGEMCPEASRLLFKDKHSAGVINVAFRIVDEHNTRAIMICLK